MDTDSSIIDIKTEDIYEDIANNVEKRFDTSSYEINRPLPYSYLIDDGSSDKKLKEQKLCNKTNT